MVGSADLSLACSPVGIERPFSITEHDGHLISWLCDRLTKAVPINISPKFQDLTVLLFSNGARASSGALSRFFAFGGPIPC